MRSISCALLGALAETPRGRCLSDWTFFVSRFSACCLATVLPRYDCSENNMQTAKAGGHQPIAPGCRREEADCAQNHEADSHYGNNANRIHPTRHHPGPV